MTKPKRSSPENSNTERSNTYAAVDLGSNSFHLLVARREHGELRVLDRIKDMVRLGGGLDAEGRLDADTQARAFASIPQDNLRAVGTQTFRRMKNANAFLMVAETALGCGIDIIAGREEARLIYIGVTQGVAGHEDRRLVIDIGGGSTELVIGEGLRPLEMESVQYGCVSLTRQFFGNGKLSRKRWNKALSSVLVDLQELRLRYLGLGWDTAIGSSGTIRAVEEICRRAGWVERDITADTLLRLRDRLLQFRTIDAVRLPGLSERRHPVLAGGLVILQACFEALEIDTLKVSPYALREGVLADMLGRLEQRDPRDKTVEAFIARYSVDQAQVERVKRTAFTAFDCIADGDVLLPRHRQLLGWAADLHETGLCVSHSQYQLHSGYLVENSDMAGFTRQEQLFLAALVRHHRRAVPRGFSDKLPTRLHGSLRGTLLCLRFAGILCRSRDDAALPEFRLGVVDNAISADLPADWIESHPLTVFDLQQEARDLKATGLQFRLNAVAS
jgi:exopolyphosphatase/guanosine-5'-triphosphate,3'-diphosphate pyrophosphatase